MSPSLAFFHQEWKLHLFGTKGWFTLHGETTWEDIYYIVYTIYYYSWKINTTFKNCSTVKSIAKRKSWSNGNWVPKVKSRKLCWALYSWSKLSSLPRLEPRSHFCWAADYEHLSKYLVSFCWQEAILFTGQQNQGMQRRLGLNIRIYLNIKINLYKVIPNWAARRPIPFPRIKMQRWAVLSLTSGVSKVSFRTHWSQKKSLHPPLRCC